jgi:predicted metal-dependent peptidase
MKKEKEIIAEVSISEQAEQLLTFGKIELLQKHPFYASLVLKMQFVEDDSVPTACIDGETIWYNPNFLLAQNIKKVAGLLAHEVMHVAMMHHIRRYGRQHKRWNYACDYAINPILIEAGMSLPDGGLIDARYQDMSAEEIYEILPNCKTSDPSSFGVVIDKPGSGVNAEIKSKGIVAQALLDAKLHKKLSPALERLMEQILQPEIDWREALARYVTEVVREDYSLSRPSVRYLFRGIYLPILESMEAGNIIILIDTSGSIDQELIDQFTAEIISLAETFSIGLTVIFVDDQVRGVQVIEQGDEIKLQAKGNGGTDFKPGFAYIEKHNLQPRAVVYLTDGYCHSYPEEPDYPVLWVQFSYGQFHPPFGDKIQISKYQNQNY